MTTPVELLITGRDESGGAFSSAGGALSKIGNIAAGILASQVFTKLAQGVKDFAVSIVEEAREAQLVQADLNAVLLSTGQVAGVTADMVNSLADKYQYLSKYTDEQIIKGETLLLQFTNIGKDVFPQATQAAIDLASRAGIDVTQAFNLVGKALANPAEGIGRLNTQYKLFDETQMKVIEEMAAAGDVAGAQQIILDKLAEKVGGAAESQVLAWDNVKKRVDNMKEALGTALLPVIDSVAKVFDKWLSNPATQAAIQNIIQAVTDMSTAFQSGGLRGLITEIFGRETATQIETTVRVIKSFVDEGLNFISDWWDSNGAGIIGAAETMGEGLSATFESLKATVIPFVQGVLEKLSAWFTENGPLIQQALQVIADAFKNYVLPAVVVLWNTIQPILSGVLDLILGLVRMVMQILTGDWAGAWETAKTTVVNVFDNLVQAAMNLISGLLGLFGTSVPQIAESIRAGFDRARTAVIGVFTSMKLAIVTKFTEIKTAITTKISEIINSIKAKVSAFTSAGQAIVQAIKNGVSNAWNSFTSWIVSQVQEIINSVVGAITGGGGGGGGGATSQSLRGAGNSKGGGYNTSNYTNSPLYNFGTIYTGSNSRAVGILEALG